MARLRASLFAALLVAVQPSAGIADATGCAPGSGEPAPFPDAKSRLERAHQVWRESSPHWTSASTVSNASLHYGFTFQYQDYLRLLFDRGEQALADEVLEAMLDLATRFNVVDRVNVYYPDGRTRLGEVRLSRPYDVLLSGDGSEAILSAAQFVGMAAEAAHRIARLPRSQRSAVQDRFAATAVPLALDHIRRWTGERPGPWTQIGLGCKGHGETVLDYMSIALRRGTRADEPLYCRGLTGAELWTVFIAVELAAALRADPTLVEGVPAALTLLDRVIDTGGDFIAGKLRRTDVIDEHGRRREGMVVQPGDFSAHPDHAYAGYSGDAFPTPADQARISGLSIDLPHAGRLVTLLFALSEHHPDPARRAEFAVWRGRLANQLAYIVFEGNLERPRFRNFLDGTNGWYRVSHQNRSGFGYPPHAGGVAWLYMPFMRLASDQPRIAAIGQAVWRVVRAEDGKACEAGRRAFGTGEFRDGQPVDPGVLRRDVTDLSLPFFVTMPAAR